MSKAALIETVAAKLGGTKKEAMAAIEATVTTIAEIAESGARITLPPLGTFQRKHKGARTGRNPRTGEPIHIAARDVVVFKPSAKG